MGEVHVSCTLDEELQLCRYVSFVDLVDLLKFNQIHLEDASGIQRHRLLRAAAAKRQTTLASEAGHACGQARPAERAAPERQASRDYMRSSLALQSWVILNGREPADWSACGYSDQCIAIVSSVGALADSLLVPDNTTVLLAHEDDLALWQGRAAVPRRNSPPRFNHGTTIEQVGIVANFTYPGSVRLHELNTRLRVILSTMLTKVIVAPHTEDRFLELVSILVRENTWATVARGTQPPFQAPAQADVNRDDRVPAGN